MSFLEMLDVVNEDLIAKGEEPIAFDHDCREGICGMCGADDQRQAARPASAATTTCQLHMRQFQRRRRRSTSSRGGRRRFRSSRTWSSTAAPSTASSQAGGFVSVNTGGAPDGNAMPGAQDGRRAGDGRGGLHRLRRLRGGVPERLGHAVRRRQGVAPGPAAAGPAGARTRACARWSSRWTRRASATAPTTASARPPAPRRSASTSSPG